MICEKCYFLKNNKKIWAFEKIFRADFAYSCLKAVCGDLGQLDFA